MSTGSFFFDPKTPRERVWIVWSPQVQPQLEQAKRWMTPQDKGELKDGAEAAVIHGLLLSAEAKGTTDAPDTGANRVTVTGGSDLLVHKAELRTQ